MITQKGSSQAIKNLTLSKNLKLVSNSALSSTSPMEANHHSPKGPSIKAKKSNVPDSFVIPMILRKTKLK